MTSYFLFDVILLLRPASFRVLISYANRGFCYLNLAWIHFGRRSKITPSCKVLRWSYLEPETRNLAIKYNSDKLCLEILASVLFTNRVLIHPVSKNRNIPPPPPPPSRPKKARWMTKAVLANILISCPTLTLGDPELQIRGVGKGHLPKFVTPYSTIFGVPEL